MLEDEITRHEQRGLAHYIAQAHFEEVTFCLRELTSQQAEDVFELIGE